MCLSFNPCIWTFHQAKCIFYNASLNNSMHKLILSKSLILFLYERVFKNWVETQFWRSGVRIRASLLSRIWNLWYLSSIVIIQICVNMNVKSYPGSKLLEYHHAYTNTSWISIFFEKWYGVEYFAKVWLKLK